MSYLVCERCKHLKSIKWHTPFEGEPLRDCGIEKLMNAWQLRQACEALGVGADDLLGMGADE